MSFLIKARFNSDGPIIGNNGGGVSFKDTSPCKNGDKCITFTAYDKQATYTINKSIILQNDFTIYLKFKINKELMDDSFNTPIISYMKPNDNYNYPFLFIQQKKYFSILLNDNEGYSSTIIDYAFDNKWHTLCITRKNNKIKFFLDGFCLTTNESTTLVDLGNQIRIGFKSEDSIYASFFNGGKMDDICILDTAIYFDNFVPPTLYFTGSDSSSNYYENRIYNIDNLSNDVKKAIERKMESRSSRLNRVQHRILPRRLRIRWNESNWYFKDMKYTRVPSNFQHTIINLYGIENPIYGNDHIRFFEGYADELIKNNKMQPFMLFLNKNFIPLSKLYIIRSDWFYTVMIKDRDPDIAGKINSIEMVTIPFPIIYEEGLEEKEDQRALYVFDKNGKFNPQSGYIYYYIDRNRVGDYLEFNGILDQYIPIEDESNGDNNQNNYSDSMFLHSVWRYGKFDGVDIDGNNANVTFVDSEDPSRGWIRSDTEILIYKNGTLWDKSRYRIIGENRIQFINYKEEDLSDNLITIQIITDTRTSIIEDLTNMKVVTVDAVTDKQSVFNIPELETGDGIPYRFFLIFRGSVCMNNRDRFVISDDYKTITFTNTEDFVDKGTSIYFCFLKLKKSDIYGSLHVKPIFLYTKTDQFDELNPSSHDYIIPIPDLNGLEFNKNNTILFVGDVFISPYSYKIENNRIITTQPGFGFSHNRNVTIVCLKMANRFEDPLDDIDKIIKDENDKGKRYVLYDLNIDKWHKITLDNFVCFDNDGTYIPDLFGEVYNRNIIKGLFTSEPLKRVPRYLTCIWDKRSLLNEANTLLPTNDDYISSYILLRNEFFELDDEFENFMSDFEIEHSRDKHYGENLAKALDYMISYNQNKLDEAFYRRKVISRFKLNTDQINKNLIEIQDSKKSIQYQWIIDRDEYYDNYNRTFVMVFVNGTIPIWYNTIKYDLNLVKFVLPNKFNSSDIIELLMFHKINNFLEKLENKVGYGGGNRDDKFINVNTKIEKQYLNPKPTIDVQLDYNKSKIYKDIDCSLNLKPFYYRNNEIQNRNVSFYVNKFDYVYCSIIIYIDGFNIISTDETKLELNKDLDYEYTKESDIINYNTNKKIILRNIVLKINDKSYTKVSINLEQILENYSNENCIWKPYKIDKNEYMYLYNEDNIRNYFHFTISKI